MIDYLITIGIVTSVFGIFALGLNLQYGIGGLANFGHISFLAIGAYTMILLTQHGIPLLPASIAAVSVAGVAGILIAIPSIRMKADFFTIFTLTFAHMVYLVIRNEAWLTSGVMGVHGFPRPLEAVIGAGNYPYFLLVLAATSLLLIYVLLEQLIRSPWGRALKAVREDEEHAAVLGKQVFLLKTQALIIGAVTAGIAGILLAFHRQFISPETFVLELTLYAWIAMVLGGIGNNRGAILGTFIVFGLLYAGTRLITPFIPLSPAQVAPLRIIIIGSILIISMLIKPEGLFGDKEELALER